MRKAAQAKLRQAGGAGGANVAHNHYAGYNPYAAYPNPAHYGMLDFEAGLDDNADLNEDDDDAPLRRIAAQDRILQMRARVAVARQGQELRAIRARLDAARAEPQAARARVEAEREARVQAQREAQREVQREAQRDVLRARAAELAAIRAAPAPP